METPISYKQRTRAYELLAQAEAAILALREERLNLDPDTRDAINQAGDAILLSHSRLAEQPHQT